MITNDLLADTFIKLELGPQIIYFKARVQD